MNLIAFIITLNLLMPGLFGLWIDFFVILLSEETCVRLRFFSRELSVVHDRR